MASTGQSLDTVMDDPRYQRLIRRRGTLGWILTALMLVTYFGFILLVAFAKPLLSRPIAGGATTLGIPLGLAVILIAFGLTAFYIRRANTQFDQDVDALAREFRP